MNKFSEDSIITEVRKNRSELVAEFGGDAKMLIEHLLSQRPAMEAAGWRYETNEELEARKEYHLKQHREEQLKMEAI